MLPGMFSAAGQSRRCASRVDVWAESRNDEARALRTDAARLQVLSPVEVTKCSYDDSPSSSGQPLEIAVYCLTKPINPTAAGSFHYGGLRCQHYLNGAKTVVMITSVPVTAAELDTTWLNLICTIKQASFTAGQKNDIDVTVLCSGRRNGKISTAFLLRLKCPLFR